MNVLPLCGALSDGFHAINVHLSQIEKRLIPFVLFNICQGQTAILSKLICHLLTTGSQMARCILRKTRAYAVSCPDQVLAGHLVRTSSPAPQRSVSHMRTHQSQVALLLIATKVALVLSQHQRLIALPTRPALPNVVREDAILLEQRLALRQHFWE